MLNEVYFNIKSKKHHYLPVHYLNGFTDSSNTFYVYDKQQDKILPNNESPEKQSSESKFYENNLNIVNINKEVRITLEESAYTKFDNEWSAVISQIRSLDALGIEEVTILQKIKTIFYFFHLFWRLPHNDKLFDVLIKKHGISNEFFGFYLEKNREKVFLPDTEIKHIKEFLLNTDSRKIIKGLLPYAPSTTIEIEKLLEKWNLFSFENKSARVIIGDNPFLVNNIDLRLDNVFEEVIVPISKNKFLCLSEKVPSFLDVNLLTFINLSVIYQSKRHVACDDLEYFKFLINKYKYLMSIFPKHNFTKETFNIMHKQYYLKSYDAWTDYYQENKLKYSQY